LISRVYARYLKRSEVDAWVHEGKAADAQHDDE
jgi:hypothetical protein